MLNVRGLFSPLKSKYCDYFYILSVIFFVFFVVTFIASLVSLMSKKPMPLSNALILCAQPLILYFINRLYYSMCINSLQN